MGISVIMPSYLGEYKGCATNRIKKLERAINSFLKQNFGELVVVSDGCFETTKIVESFNKEKIKLIQLPKQPLFSGLPRQIGIMNSSNKWITYLDSDDEFGDNHLMNIINNLDENYDWFYYDDFMGKAEKRRISSIEINKIGTSCIIHKKNVNAIWNNGYGHDWEFIKQLGEKYKKIDGMKYIVHHIPGVLDD
jgi:glycosyltransferase involved in cell wall biosynthesis